MANERYSARKNRHTRFFDVFLSGFTPMYCNSFETKEEAQEYIKEQRKRHKKNQIKLPTCSKW